MLFDMDGRQVPQNTVVQVGDAFKKILCEVCLYSKLLKNAVPLMMLKRPVIRCLFVLLMQTEKVRNEYSHDLSVLQAISIVLDRHPELRYADKMLLMWPVIFC